MYKVEVLKRCGCFTKSGMPFEQDFKTRQDALDEAQKMLRIMNSDFCAKHRFDIIEMAGNFKIVEVE